MAVWYVRDNAPTSTIGWSAVTAWSNHTATAGELVRQATTPTVGNERVFVAIVGGATGSTEPTWVVTKGAKNTSSSATYQECTGQPAVNGDLTNTPLSSSVRSTNPGLGKIIQNNAGTRIFICSTAGTCGAGEPSYVTTAVGNTTTDSGCTWTYIGTSFSAWAAPHARLQNAYASTWGAVGDDFYVADDHAQTQTSAMTLASPGTQASPTNVWCIDHTATLPAGSGDLKSDPYTTSSPACAQITTTSTGTLSASGVGNYYGIVSNVGSGAVNSAVGMASAIGRFERCSFRKLGTVASAAAVQFPEGDLIDCTVQVGNASDNIRNGGGGVITRWRNSSSPAIIGATLPTTLFAASVAMRIDCVGVDLSGLGSGKTIAGATASNQTISLINCKLGSSVTAAATPTAKTGHVYVVSSDSAGTIYRQEVYDYAGTLTTDTTIVRTGGATDGTTPLAWKIVTTANNKWLMPFESFPVSIWNDVVSPTTRTLTVYGVWGGGAVPNNDDIWIEVEYLGDSGSPITSFVNSTKTNNLASGSAASSDGSTWGGSTTAFKMAVTFTAQLAGYVRVTVKAAKASSTFYIDPKPALS